MNKFFKYFENGMPYAEFIDLTQTLSLEAYLFHRQSLASGSTDRNSKPDKKKYEK